MNALDKAIRSCDANGVHRITYKDIDGKTQVETIQGDASKVNKRIQELKDHDCKILKTEMFVNWR